MEGQSLEPKRILVIAGTDSSGGAYGFSGAFDSDYKD